ncbi:sensor histidine kinase [Niabella beijingensis]|uniref:sensor histidine kinase n=1 Tax=Niabella beijingensis TaxID=2872700 RepID=UPI001CBB667A|nr:histidine kinase [Niabella beijingensis]MBZ4188721.1 histidine kinase [Niabella beijingensis]
MRGQSVIILFLILCAAAGPPHSAAQNNITLDSSTAIRVAKDKIDGSDFNVLLTKHTDPYNAIRFNKFADTTLDNTYKQINDSTYEIFINNPAKAVYLVRTEIADGYGTNFDYERKDLIGFASAFTNMVTAPFLVSYTTTKEEIKYTTVHLLNPFLVRFRLEAPGGRRKARTFIFNYTFPKPVLKFITTADTLLKLKELNPSYDFSASNLWHRMAANPDSIPARFNNRPLLLSFEHYGSFEYRDIPNLLKYKLDNETDWRYTSLSNTPSILLKSLAAGDHQLEVSYTGNASETLIYRFNIVPDRINAAIWWILAGILVSGTVFYFIYKTRLRAARQKAQKTRLELQAIQSQLNPHFMFNALGSVQYLMNNNEKQKADHYLTEFSALLRSSLSNNEKEMIPLSEELQVLESYIALEQLRFGFRYECTIDTQIAAATIPVPTLLMQPLVENAIKHGLSPLREKGLLKIGIQLQERDLLIVILDNGSGFTQKQLYTGLGTKLVKERIAILKRNGHSIELSFSSNESDETKASLKFKNWI